MKNLTDFFAVAIISLCIVSCVSSVPKDEYRIKGLLENVPDSGIMKLFIPNGQLLHEVDRDTIIGGEFMFSGKLNDSLKFIYLIGEGNGFPNGWAKLWVGPGMDVNVRGNDLLIKTWQIESNIADQKYENDFTNHQLPELKISQEYSVKVTDLFMRFFRDTTLTDTQKIEIRQEINKIRELSDPIDDAIRYKLLDYMKVAPITNVWLSEMDTYASFKVWSDDKKILDAVDELYLRMSEQDKNTEYGKNIVDYMSIGKRVNIGDPMADGTLYDINGEKHTLSEFAGRYILLDFWSQGCGPCIQSIPEMEEIIEIYKDNLAVIGISSDGKESWTSFVKDRNIGGNQWNELRSNNAGLKATYNARGIPHYVLIAPNGIVQSTWTGYGKGSLKNKLSEEIKK